MKILKALALALVCGLLFVASDCRSPSDPGGGGGGEVAVSFRCLKQQTGRVLFCSDETSGGVMPYKYQWASDFLNDPSDELRQDTALFNYTDVCRAQNFAELSVNTSLVVTDNSGRSDRAEQSFLVCVP